MSSGHSTGPRLVTRRRSEGRHDASCRRHAAAQAGPGRAGARFDGSGFGVSRVMVVVLLRRPRESLLRWLAWTLEAPSEDSARPPTPPRGQAGGCRSGPTQRHFAREDEPLVVHPAGGLAGDINVCERPGPAQHPAPEPSRQFELRQSATARRSRLEPPQVVPCPKRTDGRGRGRTLEALAFGQDRVERLRLERGARLFAAPRLQFRNVRAMRARAFRCVAAASGPRSVKTRSTGRRSVRPEGDQAPRGARIRPVDMIQLWEPVRAGSPRRVPPR